MEAVSGVFQSRTDAENAINELRKAGLSDKRIGLITPGADSDQLEAGLPVTDTERPGMGRAMGAAVGGAMGAAGGATLGLAVATLAIPGVGPVIAFGMVGAALLGVAGATAGSAVGDTIEEELGEGVPHEDIYLYEDALCHGRSIVIAYTETDDQSDRAEGILNRSGALDLDELREYWLPVSPMAYMEKLAALPPRPQRYIYTLYDLSFPVELSRDTMRALRRHKIKHSKAAIPCGHYTLGEKPWVYLDGYKIISFLHKHLKER